jgi:hypothetical protein
MKVIVPILLALSACGMGKIYKPVERKAQDKIWRPCQEAEVKDTTGKFCNRTCLKRNNKKCSKWKTTVKDFSKREGFLFFRSGGFILIDEDNVF